MSVIPTAVKGSGLIVKVKKLHPKAKLPHRQTGGSVGYDLYAAKGMTIKPAHRKVVPCGISLEIPVGYEGQIRARSGIALKHGVAMANGVGTIDWDYRGEIGVILINHNLDESFIVEEGDRIAQIVFAKVALPEMQFVDEIEQTIRADGGMGSTGTK